MFTLYSDLSFSLLCYTEVRQDVCDFYAASKQDVVLPLKYELKQSYQLRWRHEAKTIFDRRAGELLSGKADDILQNGSLKLMNVNENNSGLYTPNVYDEGEEKGKLSPIYLCVMGRFQIVQTTVMHNSFVTFCHQQF